VIGTRLADRYEVLAELGRGGMGVVYKAKDPVLNRDVAIKLIPPGNLTQNAEDRFLREAQIVAQMDHQAIVPIYDLGRHGGSLFFVMPVLPGTNLRHLLRDGSLRLGDLLDIGTQVAEALDYSHARGIVHRDIKPENIMTAREDTGRVRARVMDFGLAVASAEDRLTKTGTLVGTVTYFSPEQVTSRTFDGRTDLYALGTVLYECLGNEPPFTGEVQTILYRIVHELPQSLRSLGADVSEELEAVVLQCLEKDPERRPKRGAHLAEALRRYRGKLHEEEYTRSVMLNASRIVGRPAAAAAPFIGREKEVAELQRRLHAALAGECQLAVIAGEPGIGKTRLVEELTTLARARKIRVLSGRFVEQDRAFAHQGFCELIQDYFRGKDPSGSSGAARPDVSDLAADLIALFPVLSEIGELRAAASGEGSRPQGAARTDDKTTVFELLARTLTRLAQAKPLVLVLEELHGADTSLEALQYVVRRLAPTPTLIVGTYRQTEVDKRHPLTKLLESFKGDPRFSALTLAPLTASEHRALVEAAAGGRRVAEDLASRLFAATEGNPFFTRELLRSLLESGGVAADDTGVLSVSGTAGLSEALPETIQEAVEKRFQNLAAEVRELAAVASVLGKSFDLRDLETLVGTDAEDAVDRLIREGVLEEERESRGDRLAFSSGIARDVLYNGLPRRKRRSLHRKHAETLERKHANRLERVYPELVHHFSQGEVPEKTVEYALRLAGKALDAFSPDEATRVLKVALDYLADDEWTGERALEGEARLLLARAHRMSGHAEMALAEAEIAVKVLESERRAEAAVAAMVFAAETAWQGRRTEETRRWVERGIEAARAAGASEPLKRLLAQGVTIANLRGETDRAAVLLAEIERLAPESAGDAGMPRGGRIVVAMTNPIAAVEPAAAQVDEEWEILGNVFETLVTTDAEGSLVPALAEDWRFLPGGRTLRVRLRRDVRFSDGTPLVAAHVKAYMERSVRIGRESIPAAFAAMTGVGEYLAGSAEHVAGIEVVAEDQLDFHLDEPLPILPALLNDMVTAVARVEEGGRVLGTGPFQFAERTPTRIVLERNPNYSRGEGPHLDAVEFRAPLSASAVAAGLRSGELDLARDLLPQDLEAILREPRFRSGLSETPKKNTYFVLFNNTSPAGANAELRRALAGVVRTQDLVWTALGRFAMPATGLLPPGILGHDPGRRRSPLSREEAGALLASSGLALPLRLRASVHPSMADRYRSLTAALEGVWRELGVEVEIAVSTMAEYLASWEDPTGIDLLIGRWNADYDDPDNFTYSLFHGKRGMLRAFFSSPESDRLTEEARVEGRPAARETLYRRLEALLLDRATLIPLFHEVDYRIAGPSVRGLNLRSIPPYVSYPAIARTSAGVPAAAAVRAWEGGGVTVPMAAAVQSLDPTVAYSIELDELNSNIFDGLTRLADGNVVPWLASEVLPEEGGRRFRFRLRRGVRFHDGRPLTARDVRYTFERLLSRPESVIRWILAPIQGADRLSAGSASELAGFRILSPWEFVIDLDAPMSFFPSVLSGAPTAILQEGTQELGRSWRDGCAGTGPFRVVEFEPGARLELERNPHYWREGLPKAEGLTFRLGVPPEEIKSEFLAGRLSLASDLLPADAESLRHDPRFASGYRESPRLITYFLALATKRGPLTDVAVRRALVDAVDVPGLLRRTVGRLTLPATGLIPPGLLGHTGVPRRRPSGTASAARSAARDTVELSLAIHPVFRAEYAAVAAELTRVLGEAGFSVRPANTTYDAYRHWLRGGGECDLALGRWDADYPDADSFLRGALHSQDGWFGPLSGTPEIDRLAELGRSEIDARLRHNIYRQAEEILDREAILLPLFHEQAYRFARPELDGLTVTFSSPTVAYEQLSLRR